MPSEVPVYAPIFKFPPEIVIVPLVTSNSSHIFMIPPEISIVPVVMFKSASLSLAKSPALNSPPSTSRVIPFKKESLLLYI